MAENVNVFALDGSFLGSRPFGGAPLKDDCFVMFIANPGFGFTPDNYLLHVHYRRWTNDGDLEIIADFDPPN